MVEADRRKGRQSGSLSSIKRDGLHDSGKGAEQRASGKMLNRIEESRNT
jgi:hypothetical protein